ncbi:hypothetical protein PhCBS80983_g04016 [Powellomyces hirtus]|uniref:Pentatricopeptide repeat-containing protein-mitochondrial domain-containing protein n=1 Tax=Powellomyces hirtus TaxID=109895 RepID=A0A507E1H9_9FUNG|nr:hypothetical protein PhCBS80983_g04016 [Powellomyces hirtus]
MQTRYGPRLSQANGRAFHVTASAKSYSKWAEIGDADIDLISDPRESFQQRTVLPENHSPGSISEMIHLVHYYRRGLQMEEGFFTPDQHSSRAAIWRAFSALARTLPPSEFQCLEEFEFRELVRIARLIKVSPQERLTRINRVLRIMEACGHPKAMWCYEALMFVHTDDGIGGTRRCYDILEEAIKEGLTPQYRTYAILLRARVKEFGIGPAERWFLDEVLGKVQVLDRADDSSTEVLGWDLPIVNSLIHGHVTAGDMPRALEWVDRMREHGLEPNTFSWLYIIHGYALEGDHQAMMRTLHTVKKADVHVTKPMYERLISGLLHCGRRKGDFRSGRKPAKPLTDVEEDRAMADAVELHEEMMAHFKPGVAIYNIFMTAYLRRKELDKVRTTFDDMIEAQVEPDVASYSLAIRACIHAENLEGVDKIFDHMCESDVQPDMVIYGNVMTAHSHNGNLEKVQTYLQHMKEHGYQPSYHIWHILINAYCQAHNLKGAYAVVEQMKTEGHPVTEITYNTLMHGYGLVGDLAGVERMFSQIAKGRVGTSIYAFNTAIAAFARNGDRESAMNCYMTMISRGYPPDEITFNILVNMEASQLNAVGAGEFYRAMINQGIQPTMRTYIPLINLYGKRDDIPRAKALQREVLAISRTSGSISPHNALLTGLVKSRDVAGAVDEFEFATEVHHARPDICTFDMLVRVHGHAGDVPGARKWFAKCVDSGLKPDTMLWNALLTAYVTTGDREGAFGVFMEMKNAGDKPDIFTATHMLRVGGTTQATEIMAEPNPSRVPKTTPTRKSVTKPTARKYSGTPMWAPATSDANEEPDVPTSFDPNHAVPTEATLNTTTPNPQSKANAQVHSILTVSATTPNDDEQPSSRVVSNDELAALGEDIQEEEITAPLPAPPPVISEAQLTKQQESGR